MSRVLAIAAILTLLFPAASFAGSTSPMLSAAEFASTLFAAEKKVPNMSSMSGVTVVQSCGTEYMRCGNPGETCCTGLSCDCSSSECQCR